MYKGITWYNEGVRSWMNEEWRKVVRAFSIISFDIQCLRKITLLKTKIFVRQKGLNRYREKKIFSRYASWYLHDIGRKCFSPDMRWPVASQSDSTSVRSSTLFKLISPYVATHLIFVGFSFPRFSECHGSKLPPTSSEVSRAKEFASEIKNVFYRHDVGIFL